MAPLRFQKSQRRQSGQASLEAILMLVIGMLVALGLLYRFNVAFKKYTIDMYGTYYRCLLETGELPGVGSVCQDKKSRFDIANGRELIKNVPGSAGGSTGSTSPGGTSGTGGSSTNPGGSSGSNSGNSNTGSGKSGTKGSSGNQAGKDSGSGSGGDGGGGSGNGGSSESVGSNRGSGGGRGSVVGRLKSLSRSRSTAVGSAGGGGAGEKDGEAKPEPLSVSSSSSSHSNSDALRRARTKMDFSLDGEKYVRSETSAVTPVTASATKKTERAGDSLRPRKAVENMSRKPAAKLDEEKGGGLEFGRLFRLFLIIGIIIAIAVFLGGQVLQISKSGDQ